MKLNCINQCTVGETANNAELNPPLILKAGERGNHHTVEPCSNGPATNGIPLIADANSWSLQVSFVSNNRSLPITEKKYWSPAIRLRQVLLYFVITLFQV